MPCLGSRGGNTYLTVTLIKNCNRDDIFCKSTEKKEVTFPGKASWMELQRNSMLWARKSLPGDPAGEREAS